MNKTTKSRKIRTLGEKETYIYLRMLEADTIKHAEMTEENKKRIPQVNEKPPRNITENSLKG